MSPAPPRPGRLLAALSEPRGRLPLYEGASPWLAEAGAASLCSPRSVKRGRGREPGLRAAAAAPGERSSQLTGRGWIQAASRGADRRALSAGSTATKAGLKSFSLALFLVTVWDGPLSDRRRVPLGAAKSHP